jgi:RimJ/RimL family protein N-acetyltransferase
LNLPKIIAYVLPANVGSIRVLEKLGFQFEKEVEEDGLTANQYFLSSNK